jgi:tripartite ATP-independent transporter DctM subunit
MEEGVTLVAVFTALLVAGVPVSFAIGLASAASLLLSIPFVPAVTTVAQRMATALDSFTLLAIPLFILAGQLMNRGGIAQRLVDLARSLLVAVPNNLAQVNVLACMLFGSISGSAVAAASAIGGVLAPRMEEEGYDRGFGAAVNISSATVGLLIPPSNILIIYSLASGGVSIAALFLAGYVPGILVGLVLMVAVALRRSGVPAVDRSARVAGTRRRALRRALPSLLLPVVAIGGILAGVVTPTEAAGVAVLYALALALAYGEIRVADLPKILLDSASITSVVLLLIATSEALAWVLAYVEMPQAVSSALLRLSDDPIVLLLLVNVVLLVVGTFLDMTPAVLVFTPIFLPVVTALGVDPVHFGIVMVLNLCIGLCTPPVGSVLFVGCSVARTEIEAVVPPLLPMYAAMVLVLLLVTFVPAVSLWLPRWAGF